MFSNVKLGITAKIINLGLCNVINSHSRSHVTTRPFRPVSGSCGRNLSVVWGIYIYTDFQTYESAL